jgi:hypothetical protein
VCYGPLPRIAYLHVLHTVVGGVVTAATTLGVETKRTVPSGYTLGESERAPKNSKAWAGDTPKPQQKDSVRVRLFLLSSVSIKKQEILACYLGPRPV